MAAQVMKKELATFKDIHLIDKHVTIKSALKEGDISALNELADSLL